MFDMTSSLSRHHTIPSASILATEDLCAVAKAVECAHKSGRLLWAGSLFNDTGSHNRLRLHLLGIRLEVCWQRQ